ncbi:MAG: methionyl-tRNA formyltransferase [Myxococcota bacterium]
MRVIFMWTPDFAVPTLDALVEAGHEIVLVVAQPDRPAGRGNKLRSPPIAERAKVLGLPLAQPRAIKRGPFPERYASVEADVCVVIAYGRILTEHLLTAPRLGCINVHASLLPRWRGAAPIQHAILAGDAETGVCTQQMEADLDTGPVFEERRTAIGPNETAASLHDRLADLAAEVAVATLEGLAATPPATPRPQPDEGITWAPKIDKADGRIDLARPAAECDRRVRAMTPWPGGVLARSDGPLKLREVALAEGTGAPGTVLSVDPLVVACGDGALRLVTVQAPGRSAVDGRSYANGARLRPGDRLGYDASEPSGDHERE